MKTFSEDTLYIKRESPSAILPSRGSAGAAGLDLFADLGIGQEVTLYPGRRLLISTGVSVATPSNTYLRIAPRSGLALKFGIDTMAGVVDEDYRGSVGVILLNTGDEKFVIKHGDRIAQGILELVVPALVEETDELPPTDRGTGGFGSTGR